MSNYDSQDSSTRLSTIYPPMNAPATSPNHPRRGPGRLASIIAVAAALLVVAFAGFIFSQRSGFVSQKTPSGVAGKPSATATVTHLPPAPLHLPAGANLLGVSMVSPTDGWAVGIPAGRTGLIFARYHNGQWSLWQGKPSLTIMTLLSAEGLSMDSPTDGWQAGVSGMLHYTNNQWVAVSIPGVGAISKVQMVSPTDGWARGFIQTPDKQNGVYGMLHYSNGAWTIVGLPPSLQGVHDDTRLDFSVTASDECWLMYKDPNNGSTEILRSTGGSFQVAYTIPQVQGQRIAMISPQDGWLAGTDASGSGNVLYHFDGSAWTKVAIPARFTQHNLVLRPVVAGASGDIWLLGINADALQVPVAARYRNGAWQTIQVPSNTGIVGGTITLVSDDEGWAIGLGGDRSALYHYQNGVWTKYPN
ncbi:MAG: hypothetical protein ACM3N4_01085 [Nitrososphaerota archaeon]